MTGLARQLAEIRDELGMTTAKSFYNQLNKNGDIGFNYSYYMRMEKGDVLPSNKVINSICQILQPKQAAQLMQAYCQSLFPHQAQMFDSVGDSSGAGTPTAKDFSNAKKELSERQVSVLGQDQKAYYLFLLSTLARKPLEKAKLTTYFTEAELAKAIDRLASEKLLISTEHTVMATAIEHSFPEPTSESIKKHYANFDKWDQQFGDQFQLDKFINKMFIRRISPRYLSIIESYMSSLFELIRSSDELDSQYNNNVIQFRVSINKGKLPG